MSRAVRSVTFNTNLTAPSWFANLPEKTWTKIATGTGSGATAYQAGATVYSVRPVPTPQSGSPEPGVTAYSGGDVDQARGELLIHGGGHNSYNGNEVYALRVRDEVPGWRRLNNPSPGALIGGAPSKNGIGQFAADQGINGAPAGNHSANSLIYCNNRLYLIKPYGMGNGIDGTARIFWFDRTTLKWTAGQKWLSDADASQMPIIYAESSPAVYVPYSNAIYTALNYGAAATSAKNLTKFNSLTGAMSQQWTIAQAAHNFGPTRPAVIGNTRLVALITGNVIGVSYGGPGLYVWDESTPTVAPVKCTITDNTGYPDPGGGWGKEWMSEVNGSFYHASSNCIVIGHGNTEYITVARIPANPKTDTWVVDKISPANIADGSRVIPVSAIGSQYTYGRFNIINDMGDEGGGVRHSAIVLFPDNNTLTATYVYKLPSTF